MMSGYIVYTYLKSCFGDMVSLVWRCSVMAGHLAWAIRCHTAISNTKHLSHRLEHIDFLENESIIAKNDFRLKNIIGKISDVNIAFLLFNINEQIDVAIETFYR